MQQDTVNIMAKLGVKGFATENGMLVNSPIDGSNIAQVALASAQQTDVAMDAATVAFLQWRQVPAPERGHLIRLFGDKLRQHKMALGRLITIESGKLIQEGLGEVQEMIDICDFAVGLSRQLYGLVIASERPGHKMVESWHPIGPVGVISAFNFPAAVWAWNAVLALVCGNSVIWKPSEKTPLTALACQSVLSMAIQECNSVPRQLSQVLIGRATLGEQLVKDARMKVISATGSCDMGRKVAPVVAARFGRAILELGGNNALIVCASANLEMALDAVVFGVVGTAGQRCTSTRRLFVHTDVYPAFVSRIRQAFAAVTVGDPLAEQTLVGPLIDSAAYEVMQQALIDARKSGAVVTGGQRLDQGCAAAFYVRPALAEMPEAVKNIITETFAPLLYVFQFDDLNTAIAQNNAVPQGLSSAIFTTDLRQAELFTSAVGSDCGIANINIGTSGAEIGGAFGGEKETGGGRESGSDAWKGYMRRSTSTLNYSNCLPLAQGVSFSINEAMGPDALSC
ncbi:MAG: aldehyde dehydrogenase family protein [Pseudomonadales bacterium]|nr:aldehyde dehydrogenase family protein [Pseudomonadales bacterium]